MSDATIPTLAAVPRIVVDASLTWRTGRPSPEVILEFDGVVVPHDLLGSLASLGWQVPAVPSPPRTAIEWVPDPVTGTAYTINPWRVTAFVLGAGDWDRETAALVASHTLAVLERHGACIEASAALVARLRGEVPE